MPDSTTDMVTDVAETTAGVVYVIQSTHHYRDLDNYPRNEDQILEDEGWFVDEASAAVRSDQLNENNRRLYDVAMDRARRDREAKIRVAETANAEAAILRANGMTKADVPVPSAFVPTPFEDYVPEGSWTSYAVLPITRSDHDGIARAQPTSAADDKTQ